MSGGFSGWTAQQYVDFRRDVPDTVISALVEHFGLDQRSRAVDLGAGTGQLAVPLSRRVGTVIAVEPEPDMLARLRERHDRGPNLLTVLGSDRDLPLLGDTVGGRRIDLLAVANALHFMDPAAVFADAAALLRPGGGIAIVSHGWPLWLADTGWSRELRTFLEEWLGQAAAGTCGLDDDTLREREQLLTDAGYRDVTVLRDEYTADLTPEYIVGNLYSALSETQVPRGRRREFEAGVLAAVQRGTDPAGLTERVPVRILTGRAPL